MDNTKDYTFLKIAYDAVDDKFGTDIKVLDISNISILAEYYIVTTASNKSQIKAMADEIAHKLHDAGLPQRHMEGYNTAEWVLLDFGVIIVHIFDKETRAAYNIEKVWADAKEVDITNI